MGLMLISTIFIAFFVDNPAAYNEMRAASVRAAET
jgi:hypothetical protein